MAWTTEQQRRLGVERALVRRYFPSVQWYDPMGRTYLQGDLTTNARNRYTVRVYIPADMPYSPPQAIIWTPSPLVGYRGASLAARGMSATMHTLTPTEGRVTVCHYRPDRWDERKTLYLVLLKVRLWLEALEAHRRTGEPLDTYLPHQ